MTFIVEKGGVDIGRLIAVFDNHQQAVTLAESLYKAAQPERRTVWVKVIDRETGEIVYRSPDIQPLTWRNASTR